MASDGQAVFAGSPMFSLTIPFKLAENRSTDVPVRELLSRTTMSSIAPVQLRGYPIKVAAKIVLFIRTGQVSLVGMTLQELGYFVYLAEALGVCGIVEAIQKKYDGFRPKTADEYGEAAALLNIATVASSINPEQMVRRLSLEQLLCGSQPLESIWPSSMAVLLSSLLPSHSQIADYHFQEFIFTSLLNWASKVQPNEPALSEILKFVPQLERVVECIPHPRNANYVSNGEIEELYFAKILGSRYENVWNRWLEGRLAVESGLEMPAVPEEQFVLSRARCLPDHLFENAMLRSKETPSNPVQNDFAWERMDSYLEERRPAPPEDRQLIPAANAVVPWQDSGRIRKMDLLKNALKTPFIKLKNCLMRNNRN